MTQNSAARTAIIITGMHRSGTSLTASLLQSAGVKIGDRLMGKGTGNSQGHFEDLDFVEFHQQVLESQGLNIAGWTEDNCILVPARYRPEGSRFTHHTSSSHYLGLERSSHHSISRFLVAVGR